MAADRFSGPAGREHHVEGFIAVALAGGVGPRGCLGPEVATAAPVPVDRNDAVEARASLHGRWFGHWPATQIGIRARDMPVRCIRGASTRCQKHNRHLVVSDRLGRFDSVFK